MDVVVIGAGALGTILAAHLSTAGHQVTVLARGRRAAQVKQHGMIVRGLVELNVQCNVLDHPTAIADADLVIVTVKTYDNDAAIASLPPRRFDTIFSVANGVLKNAQLADRFGTDAVLGCMANTSGELLDDGKVRFTRNVCLHLGELNGGVSSRANAIARTIDDCGVAAAAEEDIRVVEWSKFVGWTALLSLSVSTRFPTAKLLADPHCALLATRMMTEMAKIARARGIKIVDQSPLPVASIVAGPLEDGRDIVMAIGDEWTISAPEHRMSSLQDLERGKRLEVEETLGYALAEAKRLVIETPTLETFYELITGINATLT